MNLFNNLWTMTAGVLMFGGLIAIVGGVYAMFGWPPALIVAGVVGIWLGSIVVEVEMES